MGSSLGRLWTSPARHRAAALERWGGARGRWTRLGERAAACHTPRRPRARHDGHTDTTPTPTGEPYMAATPAHRPPMGWNSWDCYGTSVTETEVLANAGFMA